VETAVIFLKQDKPKFSRRRASFLSPFSRNFVRAMVFNLKTMKKDPIQNELRELLSRLPDTPVASNFTARLMQMVEREDLRRPRIWNFNWHRFLPRVAFALAAVLFAGVTFEHHELATRRIAIAHSVAMVVATQSLPDLDALKNFDAIQRMSQSAHADEEILAMQP
jgi:hypothetical protein